MKKEIEILKAKLEIAAKALDLAETVMDFCQGDEWERECTADMRTEFRNLYEDFKVKK